MFFLHMHCCTFTVDKQEMLQRKALPTILSPRTVPCMCPSRDDHPHHTSKMELLQSRGQLGKKCDVSLSRRCDADLIQRTWT